ncbi:DUF3662 domain-containing protein [Streptomyces sp. 21So2-11]|uniref:DUF3662 domain-containing protein n=1 Tax=Streptomyces sp. 21So2-11 TaxID=3144408 RepID=UPI0032197B8B
MAMGILGNFERMMERRVTALWASLARSEREREPVEVMVILRRECDVNAMILGLGRTLVPNAFTIELPEERYRQLDVHAAQLGRRLSVTVRKHAAEQCYSFAGPVTVSFRTAPESDVTRYRIRSRVVPAPRRER